MIDEYIEVLHENPYTTIQLDNDCWFLVDNENNLIYKGENVTDLLIALAAFANIDVEMV